ncbi:hypothetical protein HRbin26_00680 [bacterium HR26]|nr:hypothetical protein HRbin26_00680 [bacterium HR26]
MSRACRRNQLRQSVPGRAHFPQESRSGRVRNLCLWWAACARVVLGLSLGLLVFGVYLPSPLAAQAVEAPVYVARVEGTIDLGLAPYLRRVLEEAHQSDAAAVILVINTPGGRLDAALQMRDALLGSPVRTIAFIDREAFSAGALIAIASQEIFFAPGGVMGAATPVAATGETADPKVISAVRKTFKSTAEARGREPAVAEAMVDPAVEVKGLVAEGELLTLTADEALEWGYAEGTARDLTDLLRQLDLFGAELRSIQPSPAERLVRFLTEPVIASLLFTLGFLLLLGELFTEGFGVLGLSGLASLAAFFWGHYLAGLTGWEGTALILLGLALLALEAFILPGFGIAGIAGIVALLGGLFLTVAGREIVTSEDIARGVTAVAVALVTAVFGVLMGLLLLPRIATFRGLVLQARVDQAATSPRRRFWEASAPSVPAPQRERIGGEQPGLVGRRGVALTDLRPGGFVSIEGERVDVVTEGEYLRAGEPVEVVRDEGYRRVVRRSSHGDTPPGEAEDKEERWTG